MGEFEKGIIKQANAARKPLPDKVANAPQLLPGVQWYWDAFMLLTSDRVPEGPIPLRAMRSFAEDIGIEEWDDRVDFYSVIREMDMAYMKEQAKAMERKKGAKPMTGPRKVKLSRGSRRV